MLPRKAALALASCLALAVRAAAQSQEPGPLPSEAPAYFLGRQEGGEPLELTLRGRWKAELGARSLISADQAGLSFALGADPIFFRQEVDFFLKLVLGGGWFVEASVADEIASSAFSAGYQSGPGKILRELRFGNGGGYFPYSADLPIGPSGPRSPGFSALFGDLIGEKPLAGFSGAAILRYEGSAQALRRYRGMNLISSTDIASSAFIRARFFKLPQGSITNPTVYVRAERGLPGSDGFVYVPLETAIVYRGLGAVEFAVPLQERSLIAYDAADPGYDGLPAVAVDGRSAMVLYDPGFDNPHENLSRYSLEGLSAPNSTLDASVYGQNGERFPDFRVDANLSREWLEVSDLDAASYGSASAMRPFAAICPDMYGPSWPAAAGGPFVIRLNNKTPVQAIEPGEGYVPGSLSLRRDGAPYEGWRLEKESGRLILDRPLGPEEDLELFYAVSDPLGAGGSIVAGVSADIPGKDGLSLALGAGARQGLPDLSGASAKGSDQSGYAAIVGSMKYEVPGFTASVSISAKARSSDSDGSRSVEDFEGPEASQGATERAWGPSAASLDPTRVEQARGLLLFRDYRNKDALGNSLLMGIDWPSAPPALDPSAASGPYPVSDSRMGIAIVADYRIQGSASWVGLQADLGPEMLGSLPTSSAIVIPIRIIDQAGAPASVRIEAGAISRGSTNGAALEDSRRIVGVGASPAADGAWTDISIPIGTGSYPFDGQAAIRIYIDSALPSSGRLLVGTLRAVSAGWKRLGGSAEPGLSLSPESAADGPQASYPLDFPATSASAPNRWMIATIGSALGPGGASIEKDYGLLDLSGHRSLDFYARSTLVYTPGSSMGFRVTASGQDLLSSDLDPAWLGGGWKKISLDFDSRTGTVQGTQGVERSFPFDMPMGSAAAGGAIRITLAGLSGGTLEIDRIILRGMRAGASLAESGSLKYLGASPLLRIGDYDLVHSLRASLAERLELGDSFFAAAEARAGLALAFLDLEGSLGVSGGAGAAGSGVFVDRAGHKATVDYGIGKALTRYSQDTSGDSALGAEATASLGSAATLSLAAAARRSGAVMERSWIVKASGAYKSESLNAVLGASENSSVATIPGMGDYFSRWFNDYSLLLPIPIGAPQPRRTSLDAVLSGTRTDGAASTDAFAKALIESKPEPASRLRASLEAGFAPAIPIGSTWAMQAVPEYKRSAALARPVESPWIDSDFSSLAQTLVLLPSSWSTLPFCEFDGARARADLGALPSEPLEASLGSKAGLSLSRDAFLSPLDLLVPSKAAYFIERKDSRTGGSYSGSTIHTAKLGFSALDAVGAQSPLAPLAWIETDEWYGEHDFTISLPDRGNAEWNYAHSLDGIFTFKPAWSLTIRNDLRLGSADERYAEKIGLSMEFVYASIPAFEKARKAGLEWLASREKSAKRPLDAPALEIWKTAAIQGFLGIQGGFGVSGKADGSSGLDVPLSARYGARLGKSLEISAQAGLSSSAAVSPANVWSMTFVPQVSLGAWMEF